MSTIARTVIYCADGEGSMAKIEKTKSELEAMIRDRVRDLPIHLEVRPDDTFGWHPFVVAHPSVVVECTSKVEVIAEELRAQFDLKR
jgi:hypothetical protein